MKTAIIICALLAFLLGCLLLHSAFSNFFGVTFFFLLLGLAAIVASIKYTIGKNPYGYVGLGDLFVFIFFGIVLVMGTHYLQTQNFDFHIILPASSIGLLGVGVLNVNNVRDIISDKKAGKNSIPVRIGRKRAVIYHSFLLLGSLLLSLFYTYLHFETLIQLLFLIVSILFFDIIKSLNSKPLEDLDPYLKKMAISTLLFSFLFSIGIIII